VHIDTARVFEPLTKPARYKGHGAAEAQARATTWPGP
jgi:hypothetical protein